MRPLSLRASGFTCFRDDQPALDFSTLELFAIAGPTGAGKSSVLDAMTYALYGKVPRMGRQGVKELISHGRERMTVTLTFAVNGSRYVVARTTRRTGTGQCQLDRLTAEGPEPVASGTTAVNDAVRTLIGLDYDAFTQAVLLPQGEFARFLKGAAADRRRILQELLRLTVYNRMREIAAQRCATARVRSGVIEQQLQDHAAVTPEALTRAEVERTALDEAMAGLQHAAETARRRRDEVAAHAAVARDLAGRREELATIERDRPAHESRLERLERARLASALADALDRLDRDEVLHAIRHRELEAARGHNADALRLQEQAEAAVTAARSAQEAVPALQARMEALRALDGRLRHQDACLTEEARLEQAVRLARADLQAQQDAVSVRTRDLGEAQERSADAERRLAQLPIDQREWAACEGERDRAAELRRDRLAGPAVTARVQEAAAALLDLRRISSAEAEALAGARASLDRAIRERDEAWHHQRVARDAHRAMTLRAHLHPGVGCPVCEQAVTVVPAVVEPPGLVEADAAVDETAEAVRQGEIVVQQAQQAAARAAAAEEGAQADLARAEHDRAGLRDRMLASEQHLQRALVPFLPASAGRMPEHWLLERLEALRATMAERETAARACQVARETAIAAQGLLALACEKRDACAREVATLDDQLTARRTELAEVRTDIARVTQAADPRAELHDLATRVQLLETTRADAASLLGRRQVSSAAAEASLRQAERAGREAGDARDRSASIVTAALAASGFDSAPEARAAMLPVGDAAHLRDECDRWMQQHGVCTARVAELEQRVGPSPATDDELADAGAAESAAADAVSAALHRLGALDEQLSSLRQRLDAADALRAQLASARAEQETYAVLAADLQANAFQDWLLTEVFERIVRGASSRLMELTGRYTLEWLDNEFYVVDHDNARERRTADTLSGGETFLASLALALELSEQVQQAAGAVRLDSLFIDEGFGSLDAAAQDAVASAIESLQLTGRMVGIITHIRELTDRMPACIIVDKHADGSRWSVRAA